MNNSIHSILAASVSRLLKPLIRILLRHGIAYGTMAEWVRQTYVEAAADELSARGQKTTITNISTISGLTRKEAKRLSELDESDVEAANLRFNRGSRVIAGWKNDPVYQTPEGKPAELALEATQGPSFARLVKDYSGDMTTVALLDMLRSAGCIEVQDNVIRLIKDAYVPQGSSASADKITILGNDVAELIETISHNMVAADDQLRFQRKVFHTALNSQDLDAFKTLAAEASQQLLEQLNHWLQAHQIPTGSELPSHSVAVGIYYNERANQEEAPQ